MRLTFAFGQDEAESESAALEQLLAAHDQRVQVRQAQQALDKHVQRFHVCCLYLTL